MTNIYSDILIKLIVGMIFAEIGMIFAEKY
jgi:hypothetical protein